MKTYTLARLPIYGTHRYELRLLRHGNIHKADANSRSVCEDCPDARIEYLNRAAALGATHIRFYGDWFEGMPSVGKMKYAHGYVDGTTKVQL